MLRTPQGNRGNKAYAMKSSAAILRIDFTARNRARSRYVIRIKKVPDLASTRFRIHIGFKNIHSREHIQKVPDSEFTGYEWTESVPIWKEKDADSKPSGYVYMWTGALSMAVYCDENWKL